MTDRAPFYIAAHEAGHAAAHIILNDRLPQPETKLLSATTAGGGLVKTRVHRDAPPLNQAARCLAGFAAEVRFQEGSEGLTASRDAIVASIAEGRRDQWVDVQMARAALGHDAGAAAIGRAWDRACGIVQAEWPRVLALATELHEQQYMTGAEIESIWRDAPVQP